MIIYVYVVSAGDDGNIAVVGSFRKAWDKALSHLQENVKTWTGPQELKVEFSSKFLKQVRKEVKKNRSMQITHENSDTWVRIEKFDLG